MENRVLIITNDAFKSFAPDIIQVRFTYEDLRETYDSASEEAAKRTKTIRQAIVDAGFDGELLKTTSFDIHPETKPYKGKDDKYHEAFLGYSVNVGFSIDLPVNNEALSRILRALRGNEGKIRLCPLLKDREAAKKEVMAEAVKGAIEKAKIIAESSGVGLGSILRIDYSKSRVDFRFEEREACLMAPMSCDCDGAPEIDYNPEERCLSESVTVTWEIE